MPIKITSEQINQDIQKLIGLFEYLKEQQIDYEITVITKDEFEMILYAVFK